MITGFEEITYELDDYEKGILPSIVKHLKTKVGEDNSVKSTDVIKAYKQAGKKMSGARWRKIINYIRVNGLVPLLISSSKGYYIAETKEQVDKYLESLKQRINAITAVYDSIEHQYKTATK